jgi:hypothetical protein
MTSLLTTNDNTTVMKKARIHAPYFKRYEILLCRSYRREQGLRWATGWTAGVHFQARAVCFFFYCTASRPAVSSTQPPILWIPGATSPGVKRTWREADHSTPSVTYMKKTGAVPPLPVCLHGMVFC